MILGLDLSTSVIGYCVIDEDASLHSISYIKFPNKINKQKPTLFDKLNIFKEEMAQFEGLISNVAIEEPLKRFKKGESSAHVISLLGQFNGMCAATCFFLYNVAPVLYNVSTARKIALPGVNSIVGNRKEAVRDRIAALWPVIDWPVMTRGNSIGSPRPECCDMADAAVVALAHRNELIYGSE